VRVELRDRRTTRALIQYPFLLPGTDDLVAKKTRFLISSARHGWRKDEIRDATLDFVRAMQQRYSAVEVAQRRAASDAREAEGFEAALTFDLILEGPTKDPAPPPAYSKGPAQKGASRPFVPGQRGLHVSHGTTLQREPAAGAVHASGAGSGRLVPAEGGRMRRASQWAGNRRPLPQAGCE
jgi:hypothetical protein